MSLETTSNLSCFSNPFAHSPVVLSRYISRYISSTARLNLQRIKGISSILESLDNEIKTGLNSTLKSSGRVKTGRKTAHDFDESMLNKINTVRDNPDQKIKTKLMQFACQATSAFKFKCTAGKRKSRSQQQNKHHLEARKKKR